MIRHSPLLSPTSFPLQAGTQASEAGLWQHPVLLGTLETLAALAGQLAVTNLLPPHVGCIVLEGSPGRGGQGVVVESDIAGLPVLGHLSDVQELHAQRPFSAAIVSLPAGERALLLQVREVLRALAIPERFVPALSDLLAKPPVSVSTGAGGQRPPAFNMSELIGRTPYGIDRRLVREALEAKRVLITGAGGSIGSEICRIVATFRPSLLVMMERSENALFEIDRQVSKRFPDLPRKALLNDVADADATLRHVVQIKPHAVFHAAAHKHVPLMEDHPSLAIINNLFGTKSIADASVAVGAERFVMISTDKAVNPSSTMGATKRLAEMYVQWLGSPQAATPGVRPSPATLCSIVRFGNVLGSACSVLPIWGQQLAEGGPLTVTDARMTRYFMTIPEAASLVIQAGAIRRSDSSERARPTIYVLDMGEAVRIFDLAMRFARVHGYEPRVLQPAGGLGQAWADLGSGGEGDGPVMDIALTGARPGEKLHEELAYGAEALIPTPYPGVLALRDETPRDTDMVAMVAEMGAIAKSYTSGQEAGIVRAALQRYLPGFAENAVRSGGR